MEEPQAMARAWSIPTEILRAELARRASDEEAGQPTRPVCGSGKKGAYETGLHVFALFLILTISILACGFPLFNRRTSKGMRPSKIIFLCQHFGTGVLIATAFVHLLPTAFLSLTDPCLPYFFNKGYNPLAGLIAMAFALSVVWLESYLTTRGAGHSHSHMWEEVDSDDPDGGHSHGNGAAHGPANGLAAHRSSNHRPRHIVLGDRSASEGLMAGASPLPESTPTRPGIGNRGKNNNVNVNDDIDDGDGDDDDDNDDELGLNVRLDELDQAPDQPLPVGETSAPHLPDSAEQKRLMLQCLLLEAGILFHSVFIGMAISVATGPAFVVFLVAIAFHQCFEGLALGSRIAAIHFPRASYRPWLMVLAYGTTTPLGQAIGLLVHNLYDPLSQTGLLMVGIMNAISSGLLLFAGLVQLLAEDFLTEKSYKTLHGRRRTQAFLAVISGAMLMAAVGAFA
ncbi:zip family zinc transporter [Grosmannia clavigera kw1407]|uniref:Zip family zinc transporter n=1 Tax=Grosmannia clavigera (strain kw1407 / UAMH 11150) TaxID=655863 RepID=F0XCJ7_GROCL|nr:zip family zinc transporter [Grosmannia clavigera kw1407]EFX04813.1 zip family zinc transporter [Grosmannia clavigera kw1407]